MIGKVMGVYRALGSSGLLNRAAALVYRKWIRPALATSSHLEYNGVRIARERKAFDSRLPGLYRPYELQDILDYEGALVTSLRRCVQGGDTVVIVGGGVGVTTVVAAQQVGPSGSVLCYEGAETCVSDIRKAVRLNQVTARVIVTHAVVARPIAVYGDESGRGAVVPPSALPPCDVLELDCEGAEADILRQMHIRPRVIVVETHGVYGAATADIETILARLCYEVMRVGVAEERLADVCERNDIYVLSGLLTHTNHLEECGSDHASLASVR
jgi:hypothetical protein